VASQPNPKVRTEKSNNRKYTRHENTTASHETKKKKQAKSSAVFSSSPLRHVTNARSMSPQMTESQLERSSQLKHSPELDSPCVKQEPRDHSYSWDSPRYHSAYSIPRTPKSGRQHETKFGWS